MEMRAPSHLITPTVLQHRAQDGIGLIGLFAPTEQVVTVTALRDTAYRRLVTFHNVVAPHPILLHCTRPQPKTIQQRVPHP